MFCPRVLIVAEHASAGFGGEAILPLHYFRGLRRRGVEAFLVVHERTRDELVRWLPEDIRRVTFIPDVLAQRALFRLSTSFPERLATVTFGYGIRLITQIMARRIAKRLVRSLRIDVVHQPIPVSPREPSLMYDLGAPVVIGPANGGMCFPPAFAHMNGRATKLVIELGRRSTAAVNGIMPGKLEAAALLYANERTRRALPQGARGRLIELVENGVDLAVFTRKEDGATDRDPAHFAFLGRLVDWKAVDVAIDALAACPPSVTLDVIGDGPLRPALEAHAREKGVSDRVAFTGWLSQEDAAARLRSAAALLLPSVLECGGAVVLEAMACGVPVVATRWGGPADYLDDDCGILVEPSSRAAMVAGFAAAMSRLAEDPSLAHRLGERSRRRVEAVFDWDRKIDRILEIYAEVVGASADERALTREEEHIDGRAGTSTPVEASRKAA